MGAMFYGPFGSNEWRRIKSHIDHWFSEVGLTEFRVPAHGDPMKALAWIVNQEKLSSKAVDDAGLKLAQFPRRGLPRLNRRARHFFRERLRMVVSIVEALASESPQTREPVPLFEPPRYEGLEEQQIAWALVAYWHELGRNRWHLEQFSLLTYAASLHGWKAS